MSRIVLFTITLFACLACSSCAKEPAEQRAEFFVFGTILEVTARGVEKQDAERAFSALHKLFREMHSEWHAWEPGLLVEINRSLAAGLPALASTDIIEMIRHSQWVEEQSGGRFNPAIGALIGLWGFHTSDYPVSGPPPRRSQIEKLVSRAPSSLDIQIDGSMISSLNPSVQLDFGGIAKGYAIDIACDTLRKHGIDNAIVNAGGDLRAIGDHGERPWRIAVRDPAGGIIGVLEAGRDEAIFTSGNYERFRQDKTERYPHILNPLTGWPVRDVASVTVITGDGWMADAAATALIVAGLDDWKGVARALGLEQVLIVDEDGKAYLTEKMNERMEFEEGIVKAIVLL